MERVALMMDDMVGQFVKPDREPVWSNNAQYRILKHKESAVSVKATVSVSSVYIV